MQKVLIISQELPFPLNSGGKVSIYSRCYDLSKNAIVDLWCLNLEEIRDENLEEAIKANLSFLNDFKIFERELTSARTSIKSFLGYVYNVFFENLPRGASIACNRKLEYLLRIQHEVYDLILFENFNSFNYYLRNEHYLAKNKIGLITHNYEKKLADHEYRLTPFYSPVKLIKYLESKKIEKYEKLVYQKSPRTFCISKKDMSSLSAILAGNFIYLPQHLRRFNFKWSFPRTQKVIFNANLKFAPNIEGLFWYLNKVHPLILQQFPRYKLSITGFTPIDLACQISTYERVDLTGFLDEQEFNNEFMNADVMINPVHCGSGVKIKILDAISIGIPIISTTHSASGLDEQLEVNIARNETQFSSMILKAFEGKLHSTNLCVEDYNTKITKFLIRG